TGIWGLLVLHLADDSILPFNYISYANQLLKRRLTLMLLLQFYKNKLSNLLYQQVSLHPLTMSIQEFASAAKQVDDESK
ncbi:hypothetical protein S83_012545, partial [Arachis hypogaea]